MAASITFPWYPKTLTDRRNDITTLNVQSGVEALSLQDVAHPRPATVELEVDFGGTMRRIKFSIGHTPTPAWFAPALKQSGALLLLPANWDLQGASPIDPSFIQLALDSLCLFMDDHSALPQWTPGREGGVQLDWHEAGIDLEIEFSPTAIDGYVVLSDLEGRVPEYAGSVEDNLEPLCQIFRERLLQ